MNGGFHLNKAHIDLSFDLHVSSSSTLLPDTVHIETGTLQGISNTSGRLFLGIPFAAPPVGAYRWQPPYPALPWSGVRNAQAFGPGCIQDCSLPPLTCPTVISEDCLYLDVYTPSTPSSTPLPVMVFFPGGEFLQGTAGTILYDGTHIATLTNTIVVITNYRLGALGFLLNDVMPGNYGFLDQQFALQWVQRNIGAFGGDAQNVTIFGQSAGGTSTTAHMISPTSNGLFHRAIIESNPVALNLNSKETQKGYSDAFARFAGCDNVSGFELTRCLLGLSADVIVAAQTKVQATQINMSAPIYIFYPWTPTIDHNIIPAQPVTLFQQGAFNHVPFILGNVRDEAWLFIWEVQPFPVPAFEYHIIIKALFGDNAPEVEKLYPVGPFALDTRPQLNSVITDYLFVCPGRFLAQSALRTVPGLPVYHYDFSHVLSFYESWGPDYQFCWYDYVCHGSELPFVFDSATLGGFQYTNEEAALAEQMAKYWGNFAHSSNPNLGPGGTPTTQWPGYDLQNQMTLDLNVTIGYLSYYRASYCDYWDSVGYFQP